MKQGCINKFDNISEDTFKALDSLYESSFSKEKIWTDSIKKLVTVLINKYPNASAQTLYKMVKIVNPTFNSSSSYFREKVSFLKNK